MNPLYRLARKIVKSKHLIADPNLYFDCSKRVENPAVFLTERNLLNCRALPSREEMLKRIPTGSVCIEVGVAQGYFSEKILETINPQKLYLIEYDADMAGRLAQKFEAEIRMGRVTVLCGDSVEMLRTIPESSIDFVYLDATHDYEHPKAELEICKNIIKTDGIIAGHDYTRFSMWECSQYGVIEAVNEFCISNGFEMIYITMDVLHSNASYALMRISDGNKGE